MSQNCVYSTQGALICKSEEKAIPVVSGYPDKTPIVFEGFSQSLRNNSSRSQVASQVLLRGQALVDDPNTGKPGVLAFDETFATDKDYSCSIDNCYIPRNECKTGQGGSGLACNVVCDKCCRGNSCKFTSKSTGNPVWLKEDGTVSERYKGVLPCLSIDPKNRTTIVKDRVGSYCQQRTFQEQLQDMKTRDTITGETVQETDFTESFIDTAAPVNEVTLPFYDQRVFRSFWV